MNKYFETPLLNKFTSIGVTVQERQQSLSLMERLNSEKRTRQQLEEEVFKLQVNCKSDIGLGLVLITEPPISGLKVLSGHSICGARVGSCDPF